MSRQPRNLTWILVAIVFLSFLAGLVNSVAPNSILILSGFFLLVGLIAFFTSLFILNNVRRSILISLGLVLFLILRYLGLHELTYIILLVACLTSLELFLRKQ